jgi:carbonic anhydrase
MSLTAQIALERLREGNRRFASGVRSVESLISQMRRQEFVEAQKPFAIILGCSDSRVPVEIVFDQGLGDLFVIRVAGNIVAPSQIGSVEFAAEQFGARLVVVLGHTNCGAINATLQELTRPTQNRSPNLQSIVNRIRPAVEQLLETDLKNKPKELLHHCTRANIRASVSQLQHGSQVIERLIAEDGLMVVGAEYSVETGQVVFL